ncbi:MAG: divergent polysaccharide deacetylase family protein [Proteobacteria bacterium]|nr:divergent polysaccharide deacetylase family protein [Pseudomonadota bacterium]MBU1685913.1 divergent polysaccharide deacetylase family protein [Pseudomonadota bacterium]
MTLLVLGGILLVTGVAAFILLFIRPFGLQREMAGGGGKELRPPPVYEEPGTGHSPPIIIESSSLKRRPLMKTEGKGDPVPSVSTKKSPQDFEEELPLVAIVIDDMGYQKKIGDDFLNLPVNLSFAFLPSGPFTGTQSARARRLGRDILLHFPMQTADPSWDPGPGTIRVEMDRDTIRQRFTANLAALPLALGINNHMGSLFTENRQAMQFFLELVNDHSLFFLDSMTSRNSVGYLLAREMGIKTARRDVFLDNERTHSAITGQLRGLLSVAEKQGWAVGIGHPHPETLKAISAFQGDLDHRVEVVSISRIMH